MVRFRYLIETRFNIDCDPDVQFWGNDPTYLEQRFQLFETYCLPSIAAQTYTDFLWLVLFHPDTPEPFRSRIKEYAWQYAFFRPVFCNVTFPLEAFYSSIVEPYTQDCEWLVSTRLDNDDMLHRNYLKRLHEEITAHPPTQRVFYSFPEGLQIFLQEQAALRLHFVSNHFLSVVEPARLPMTALGMNHRAIKQSDIPILYIKGIAAWAEIVHACNWMNDYVPHTGTRIFLNTEKGAYPLSLAPYQNMLRNASLLMRKHIRFRGQQLRRLFGRLLS